jgi:hypothetical protein
MRLTAKSSRTGRIIDQPMARVKCLPVISRPATYPPATGAINDSSSPSRNGTAR